MAVDVSDDIGRRAVEVALQSCAEEGVDDDGALRDVRVADVLVYDDLGVAQPLEADLVTLAPEALVTCVCMHVDKPFLVEEQSRESQPVGPIVTRACEHDDPAARVVVDDPFAKRPRGTVNELDVLNALQLGRAPVDVLDVVYGEKLLHLVYRCKKRRVIAERAF